jgi:multiple sugar transport system permease protein
MSKKIVKKIKWKEEILGTTFAAIPVFGFLLFNIVPIAMAIYMSFCKVSGYDITTATYVGFDNFKYLFTNENSDFWLSVKNTLYALLSLPLSLCGSIFIAALLNKNKWMTKTLRIIYFLPYACSVVAVTAMWKWIFDYNYGILNSIFVSLGLGRVGWLTESSMFMPSMLIMNVWSGMGYGIILLSAALTNLPKSVQEAAILDGAGPVRTFFSVILPCISPTIFFLLSIGLINGLQVFPAFQVMAADGGPNKAGLTSVFFIYRAINSNMFIEGMGIACAATMVLTLFIAGIVVANFKLQKLWVHYD